MNFRFFSSLSSNVRKASNAHKALIAFCVLSLSVAAQVQRKSATNGAASSKTGTEDAQLYRNAAFGFRYKIPYGWVDRTAEMNSQEVQRDAKADTDVSSMKARDSRAAEKAEVLLGVFERPPEASGEGVNAGVVIASESASSYPGLKKAEDYVGPITEVAISQGFKSAGDPYTVEVEGRQLVRVDFVKSRTSTVTMRQCTLILLAKGRIVSFTFIASGEDELDDIMDGLHFGPGGAAAH